MSASPAILTYVSINEMIQDNATGYSDVVPGDIIHAGGWTYQVTSPAAGDAHITTDTGVGLYAVPSATGAIHTSQLGWQSGDDITQEFVGFVSTSVGTNLHVIFDDSYQISGSNLLIPDGTTLEGTPGSGLEVTGIAQDRNSLFDIGSDTEILNMNFLAEGPDQLHQDYRLFEARDEDDILVSGSNFEGNIGIFIDLHRGSNFVSEGNVFEGGITQMRWVGRAEDYTVNNTAFIGSAGDGIKTVSGGGEGTVRATISNSLFAENARDGIDTTGGFKNSIVSNSTFVENGQAIDIKTIIDDPEDFSLELMNENILITDCEFIDQINTIAFTTIDRLGNPMDAQTASLWAVQNVHIQDSTFENNGASLHRAFLIKDAHDISWDNIQLLGNIVEVGGGPNYNWGMPYAIGGTNVTTGDARGAYDWQSSFVDSMQQPLDILNQTITPTDPVAPTEPLAPADPSAPPQPTDPIVPTEPTDPVEQTDASYTPPPPTPGLTIRGNGRDNVINGSEGDDELRGKGGDDKIAGDLGNDMIYGGRGSDKLSGDGGDDVIRGGKQADVLSGHDGDDHLYGGKGADTLNGGVGNDNLYGGTGVDTFVYGLGFGADRIRDFDAANDSIEIKSELWDNLAADVTKTLQSITQLTASGAVVDFGGGDVLYVDGATDVASLHAKMTGTTSPQGASAGSAIAVSSFSEEPDQYLPMIMLSEDIVLAGQDEDQNLDADMMVFL